MCNILGRIITVEQANAEAKADAQPPMFYMYFWRTNRGIIRKTGFVRICACGKRQRWAKTKKELLKEQTK